MVGIITELVAWLASEESMVPEQFFRELQGDMSPPLRIWELIWQGISSTRIVGRGSVQIHCDPARYMEDGTPLPGNQDLFLPKAIARAFGLVMFSVDSLISDR